MRPAGTGQRAHRIAGFLLFLLSHGPDEVVASRMPLIMFVLGLAFGAAGAALLPAFARPKTPTLRLDAVEQEVVFLWAIERLIRSMLNHQVLRVRGTDPHSEVQFETDTQRKFFNIGLVEFLSRTDQSAPVKQRSYMQALRAIVTQPFFDVDNSVAALKAATLDFGSWLQQEVTVDTWLPSLDTSADLRLRRMDFIRMCGNISKHNALRLGRVASELRALLAAGGVRCTAEDALMALDRFYERFHTDILTYHASTVAEFLNNVLWGIHEYLAPEYNRSHTPRRGGSIGYSYDTPPGIENAFARNCYWDLMNEIRATPILPRFQVSRWLKLRY